MPRYRWLYLFIVMVLIFLLLAAAIRLPGVQHLDLLVLAALMLFRTELATFFFKFISFLGTPAFFYPATALLGIAYYTWQRREGFLSVVLTMIVANGIMEWLKDFYHRPRPALGPIETVPGFSFPSGHAMMGTVFYSLLALWLLKTSPSCWRRYILLLTIIFLLLLGFSRLYLGVHYPTDILAGYAGGAAILAVFLAWWNKR